MMSGFREDVISILRQNAVLQKESIGYIVGGKYESASMELYKELKSLGHIVARGRTKPVVRYDYVVIPINWSIETLLYALSISS